MGGTTVYRPIVSKLFCPASVTTLMVRKRPHVVGGGGFVVTDADQKLLFMVEGCGIHGMKGQVIVKDSDGASVLFLRKKKAGFIQAMSTNNHWEGYLMDDEGVRDMVFSLSEPKPCWTRSNAIRIKVADNEDSDYEVTGTFPAKCCTISVHRGNLIAKVGMEEKMNGNDMYRVVVEPGNDQAFVIGVIAILDNIHGETTSC